MTFLRFIKAYIIDFNIEMHFFDGMLSFYVICMCQILVNCITRKMFNFEKFVKIRKIYSVLSTIWVLVTFVTIDIRKSSLELHNLIKLYISLPMQKYINVGIPKKKSESVLSCLLWCNELSFDSICYNKCRKNIIIISQCT